MVGAVKGVGAGNAKNQSVVNLSLDQLLVADDSGKGSEIGTTLLSLSVKPTVGPSPVLIGENVSCSATVLGTGDGSCTVRGSGAGGTDSEGRSGRPAAGIGSPHDSGGLVPDPDVAVPAAPDVRPGSVGRGGVIRSAEGWKVTETGGGATTGLVVWVAGSRVIEGYAVIIGARRRVLSNVATCAPYRGPGQGVSVCRQMVHHITRKPLGGDALGVLTVERAARRRLVGNGPGPGASILGMRSGGKTKNERTAKTAVKKTRRTTGPVGGEFSGIKRPRIWLGFWVLARLSQNHLATDTSRRFYNL